MLAALHKLAFGTNAFSGPMNPNIESGASVQAPPKRVSLQSATQKTAELWPGFFAEMLKESSDVNIGQWWEQVGGPFLAKGGDHKKFKTMMNDAAIPPAVQRKFENVAKEKYTNATVPSHGSPMNFGGRSPGATLGLTAAALGAPLLYQALSEKEEDPHTRFPAWKGRAGHYIASSGLGASFGYTAGNLLSVGGARGKAIGAGLGALGGAGLGELAHRRTEREAQRLGERAAHTGKNKKLLEEGAKTQAHWSGEAAKHFALPGLAGAYYNHSSPLPHAASMLAATLGTGLATKRQHAAAVEHYDNALAEKAAAGAPTRGNFMMASDIPAFKAPRLDRPIQKEGDMSTEDVRAYAPSLRPKKEKDAEGSYMPYGPGDFKRSKYAMPMGELSAFVAELREKGASMTPAGQLNKSQRVGAPKASAPPGPSIADIAKPTGKKFGIGLAGCFKGKI